MKASCAQVRIAHGTTQLPESQWQSLVVGRPALRLEVLKAIENTAARPLRLQTFLLEDHTGLVAAAVCEPIPHSSDYNRLDTLLFGRAAAITRRLGVSTQPLLLFKTPLGRQSPVVLRPANPAQQQQVVCGLLDGIEEYAARLKFGVAFIDVMAADDLLWSVLRSRRYLESEIDSTARMEIEWRDFDGYVDCLRRRSKNAARAARRERNSNRRSGVSIRQLQLGAADAQALYELTRDHYRHKNGTDPLYGPEFLPLLSKLLGDDLLVFEAVREGQRTAMLAVVRSGSVGWVAWIGIELRDRPNDFTYANLTFYHATDWAPALGLTTLLYGTAALEAKLKRGCRLFDCRVFYRPHRRLLRAIAQPYFPIHQAWYRRKSR